MMPPSTSSKAFRGAGKRVQRQAQAPARSRRAPVVKGRNTRVEATSRHPVAIIFTHSFAK